MRKKGQSAGHISEKAPLTLDLFFAYIVTKLARTKL